MFCRSIIKEGYICGMHSYPSKKTCRTYLYVAVPVMLLSWILFKVFYPFADYFTDSYTYIQAAADKDLISYRPIGYSVFLRIVHAVSVSDTFLVSLQYVLVQGAGLCLFFVLITTYRFSLWTQRLLLAFLLLNPLIHYICNCVSSDALFIFGSLFWVILLLRLVRRPSVGVMIAQAVLLLLLFYLRYIALYAVVVSVAAF